MTMSTRKSSALSRHSNRAPFLDKAELVDSGEVIVITSIDYSTQGDYGPQWICSVTREDNSEGRVGFPAASYRDDFFRELAEEAKEGGIPAKVRRFTTKRGQIGYDLADPADDTSDTDDTDDVPF